MKLRQNHKTVLCVGILRIFIRIIWKFYLSLKHFNADLTVCPKAALSPPHTTLRVSANSFQPNKVLRSGTYLSIKSPKYSDPHPNQSTGRDYSLPLAPSNKNMISQIIIIPKIPLSHPRISYHNASPSLSPTRDAPMKKMVTGHSDWVPMKAGERVPSHPPHRAESSIFHTNLHLKVALINKKVVNVQ